MNPNEALLIIDYTNDFVDDDGALTVGQPGQDISDRIIELADEMNQAGGWVILPTDVHVENDLYHPETLLFPPHNLRDTWGREFFGPLKPWFAKHEDDEKVYMYDKTRYSAFAGTDLDIRLRERHIEKLHLVGVCTDICVLHTAVDAYNLSYNMEVHSDAVAALTPAGNEWALNHFDSVLGADVTSGTKR